MIDPVPYLRRIGMDAQTGAPSVELLTALQLQHLMTVPFENLDVVARRGVRTDLDWSVRKIVDRRRGGWCFELNGAFGALLHALGFDVNYVSCRVFDAGDGTWGPDFDHLALVVRLAGSRFFVDVGFGDNCLHPLELVTGERDAQPRRARLEVADQEAILTELVPLESGPIEWEPQLRIAFEPRTLDEFAARSTYLRTEPGLSWSEKPFATQALDGIGGRLTLRTGQLRRRHPDLTIDVTEVTAEEWSTALQEWFGIDSV